MIYCKKFEIGLNDIGKNNEVTNTAILKYLENIASSHSASIGYGLNETQKTKITWVLLEWKLKVLKRFKYGNILKINTWGRLKNKCYCYRDFEIYDEENNLCAIATSKWLLIDIIKGKITKIEEDFYQKYQPEIGKSVFNIDELDKIKEPDQYNSSIIYKVNRADIDVNNHMHNLRYLDLAYEALPEDIYNNETFSNVRITYKKEIKYGEEVECKYTYNNDEYIVGIYSKDGTVLHSIVILSK